MNWVIIVAGGRGERMGLVFNKVFVKLGKYPILYWTLRVFEKSKSVNAILISASKTDLLKVKALARKFKKVKDVFPAANSRQDSTLSILEANEAIMKKDDLVGVHNAANPFVSQEEITKVFNTAKQYGAALLAQPAKDTVKITNGGGLVAETPLRVNSWYAQTPQVASFKNMYKAHKLAKKDKFSGTDDSQLLERIGIKPKVVPCSNMNFKITFKEDLVMAREILKTWTA